MAGFAVCLLELPCTGGPYFFILGLMAEKTTRLAAIPLLIYYNLIFILPQIVITLLVYLGFPVIPKVAHWKHKSTRALHLAIGLMMITLGTITLLELT